MRHVFVVLGTRPEVIKLWSVVRALKARGITTTVYATGQHRIGEPLAGELGLLVDVANPPMAGSDLPEGLGTLLTRCAHAMDAGEKPDLVLVQGDTMSAFAGALAGFLAGIPVAHVEAGLRTYDLAAPFPEEGLRQMISRIAALHFAPTELSRSRLREEGTVNVRLTGNTIVDAIQHFSPPVTNTEPACDVLVTLHRREAWSRAPRVREVLDRIIGRRNPSVRWILHPNPELQRTVAVRDSRIHFMAPLDYVTFLRHLRAARCVVTDSGGVLEEAVTLGVPTVIVRDRTERPEAFGDERMVQMLPFADLCRLEELLIKAWQQPMRPSDVFGGGRAGERIAKHVETFLAERSSP